MTFATTNLCQQYQAALLLAGKCTPGKELSQVYCTDDKYEVRTSVNLIKLDLTNNFIFIFKIKGQTRPAKLSTGRNLRESD